MDREEIDNFIELNPITKNGLKIEFNDGSIKMGYFENLVGDHYALWKDNKHRIVENHNSSDYKRNLTNDKIEVQPNVKEYTTIINGDDITNLSVI